MKIGIDLGGTKTEGILIDSSGKELKRERIKTEKWKIGRDLIINKLDEVGIGTSVDYLPVHMHSYYSKKYGWRPEDFPLSYELSKKVISLPIYPLLKDDEIKYIIDNINNLWLKHKI